MVAAEALLRGGAVGEDRVRANSGSGAGAIARVPGIVA